MVNVFYQPVDMLDVENTYKCRLAMNHHNITETKDTEYYSRCVERFRELVASDYDKIYLHICPVITLQRYEETKEEMVKEIVEFDRFVNETMNHQSEGLVFIIARYDSPEYTFRTEQLDMLSTGTCIYVIYANRDFIDAGEVFMGNYHEERMFIESKIREAIDKK
jgi:hypothetical protein